MSEVPRYLQLKIAFEEGSGRTSKKNSLKAIRVNKKEASSEVCEDGWAS